MVRIVKAKSVKDYLDKYYKKARFVPGLLDSYQEDFEKNGYVCTSHHDNVIGEFIAWPFYPGQARKNISQAENQTEQQGLFETEINGAK